MSNKLQSPKTEVKLRIADIVIQMQSRFPLEQFSVDQQSSRAPERFKNFFYKGNFFVLIMCLRCRR